MRLPATRRLAHGEGPPESKPKEGTGKRRTLSRSAAQAKYEYILVLGQSGTVLGIVSMALTLGNYLRIPRAVAILTSGYGLGQIAGPLVATPLLRGGYHVALLVGAAIVLTAGLAAAALAISFPGRKPAPGQYLPCGFGQFDRNHHPDDVVPALISPSRIHVIVFVELDVTRRGTAPGGNRC